MFNQTVQRGVRENSYETIYMGTYGSFGIKKEILNLFVTRLKATVDVDAEHPRNNGYFWINLKIYNPPKEYSGIDDFHYTIGSM